jgi:predicted nuclease of predicted toxin-antitoxin system
MHFLTDMGISLRTVEWLREKGHDVVHLRDEGLQRLVYLLGRFLDRT